MPKHCSDFEKGQVATFHELGLSNRAIADKINQSESCPQVNQKEK